MIINTNEWVSQSYLAKKLGCTRQNIAVQVKKGKFKSIVVPELGRLVENRSSLKVVKKSS